MLDYEWGNTSSIMLSADDDPSQDSDQSPQILDDYTRAFNETLVNSTGFGTPGHHHYHFLQPDPMTQTQLQFHSVYDPRSYGSPYPVPPPPPAALLSLEPVGSTNSAPSGFLMVPKTESIGVDFPTSRIGLNLGGRTYFSSSEEDFVNRLYRRSRALEPSPLNKPRCQAEGCNADLTHAKHYHRRHKVCEFHSKAATVIAAGLTQRFCQQCSRFLLTLPFT